GDKVQSLGQRHLDHRTITPHLRPGDAITTVQRLHRVIPFDTRRALAHRRVGIALDRDSTPVLDPHQQPAPYPAQAAWRLLPDRGRLRLSAWTGHVRARHTRT